MKRKGSGLTSLVSADSKSAKVSTIYVAKNLYLKLKYHPLEGEFSHPLTDVSSTNYVHCEINSKLSADIQGYVQTYIKLSV